MDTLKHEELYRTKKVLEKMAKIDITICGIGAIGSNLIDNMIRQGFKSITAIDKDRIELHNTHTQIWTTRDVGQLKANIMRNHAFMVSNEAILTHSKELTTSNITKYLSQTDIVIDSFDNIPSRKLVADFCKTKNLVCLHIGLAKDYAEVIWDDKYRIPDETDTMDVCEYPLARNIILLAISVATEILIKYVTERIKDSYIITLSDLKIEQI